MTATLIEIGELDRTRPAVDAPSVVLAGWYERKAALLVDLAADTWSLSERDTYEQWAEQAHIHAQELFAVVHRGEAIR